MKPANLGLCNKCRAPVPAEFFFRDGQVWIRKDCPDCGPTESLVSTDAAVWQAKRDLWQYVPTEPTACTPATATTARIDHKPNIVFLDVTNRCNMNCPICIATIRGMGFDFNPPMAYFEKIFAELGRMEPKPVVQLFGGEPTVRDDLLEIIAIARKHGLKPHVVTNGVRLADEEYCRKLCEARVPLRFAFDGRSPDIYEKLRDNRAAYDKKMKALENLKQVQPPQAHDHRLRRAGASTTSTWPQCPRRSWAVCARRSKLICLNWLRQSRNARSWMRGAIRKIC